MRMPDFKRLDKQNFKPEDQQLIELLAFTINNDMEVLYNALKRRVSLKDNIFCTVKDVQVVVTSGGIPKNTASIRLEEPTMRVLGCQVIRAINQDNVTTYPNSAPFVSFTQNSSVVNINHVTGLQADTNYLLTIVAWGS